MSIIAHLLYEPYDTSSRSGLLLHRVEVGALATNFVTFWVGLSIFLDSDTVATHTRILMTVVLFMFNVFFVLYAMYLFIHEHIQKRRNAASLRVTEVHPSTSDNNGNPGASSSSTVVRSSPRGISLAKRKNSTLVHADRLHTEHLEHERRLREKHAQQAVKQRRQTAQRVKARTLLRQSRALQNSEIFSHLSNSVISRLIENMEYISPKIGTVILKEGDIADALYVVVRGKAVSRSEFTVQ